MVLASYYREFGSGQSFTRWREAGKLVFRWERDGNRRITRPFSWVSICEHLEARGALNVESFGFPPLLSPWMDSSVSIGPKFQAPATDGSDEALTIQVPSAISEQFPVKPQLDREGRALSSLQLLLLGSWERLRTRLIEQSDEMFAGDTWLLDFFSYLSTIVATVDNTLHQIYYRAKHEAHHHGWTFDAAKLGLPHARRIKDKLAWVGQISGKPLDMAGHPVRQFLRIKDVRNHVAHFDPPVLAFTIEDAASWLNASTDIAMMLAEIRRNLGEPLCVPLVALMVAKDVDWYAHDAGRKRVSQTDAVGYASSCWRPDDDVTVYKVKSEPLTPA